MLLIGGVGAGAALAAGGDGPSPQQAHEVEHDLAGDGIHLPGWRQELDAETVQCLVGSDDGPPRLLIQTRASEFPLEELLTRERLVEECATGNDAARQREGIDARDAAVCVSRSTGRTAVVVLGGSCGELAPLADDDLARLNRLRAVETAMLAVPSATDCPTVEEATSWAQAQLRKAGLAPSVSVMDEGRACYRPVAYWDNDEVLVQALGLQPQ